MRAATRSTSAGFTIVEIVVSLVVLSLVLLALSTALVTASKIRSDATLSQDARNQATRVMDAFALDLSHAVVSTVSITTTATPTVTVIMRLATGVTTTANAQGIPTVMRDPNTVTWSYTGTNKLTRTAFDAKKGAMQTVTVIGPRTAAEATVVPTLDAFTVQRLGATPVYSVSLAVSRPGIDSDPTKLPAKVKIRYQTSSQLNVKAIDE